jgi:hypothetical protein
LKKNADAPKVRAAFEARAEGKSWKTVVGILGVKSQGNAAAILANRCYLGEARSGDFVKEKAHPPIVSEEVFRRAQRKQTVRSDTATRREGALLALVCRCQTCGHALTYDASAVKPIYRCKYLLCSRRAAVQAASIEGYVFHQALVWHAVLGSMYEDTIEVAVFEEELAKAQAVVAELDAALDAKEIDATSYGKAATAARVVAAGAATALADAEASNGWLGMNTDAVQRRLLADGLVPVEDGIPRPVCKDIPAGRDFCQQMVRVIVRPVGRGKRVPVADRVDVECLTPVGVAQPEVLAV